MIFVFIYIFKIGSVRGVASLVLQSLQGESGEFNSFQPHNDIGALERPQIPKNDKGASCLCPILLPSGSFTPFFLYTKLGRPPFGWRLGYSPTWT